MNRISRLLLVLALGTANLPAQVASHKTSPALAQPASVAVASMPAAALKPVARVNGVVITERDLQEQEQRLFPYYSMHGGKVPDKYKDEIRKKAIDQLVNEELMYQAAKKQKLVVPAATMKKVLRDARGRFKSQAEYVAYARAGYGSVQAFEQRIRRAVTIAMYTHNEIELKAQVPEARVRKLYNDNKKMFVRPESVHLQTISVNLPPNPSEDQKKLARKRIEELLPQAKATKTFEEFGLLAERVSEDDYRVMMGDNKWIHVVGMPPDIAKVMQAMQPGQVSDTVSTPVGYIIFRMDERRPQHQMSYAEMKDKIRQQLQDAQMKERAKAVNEQIHKGAKIEVL